mgnify:CR=1 FL=1
MEYYKVKVTSDGEAFECWQRVNNGAADAYLKDGKIIAVVNKDGRAIGLPSVYEMEHVERFPRVAPADDALTVDEAALQEAIKAMEEAQA